jgi:hypothetical protein
MKDLTPKEKAKELIDTYRYALSIPNAPLGDYKDNVAKQCAIIAVNEMIDENDLYDRTDGYVQKRIDYLIEVKQELNKES